MIVCSVYDVAVESFNAPFAQRSIGEACRNFDDQCKERESMISKHPEDYVLFKVGEFDQVSGELKPDFPPVRLVQGRVVSSS